MMESSERTVLKKCWYGFKRFSRIFFSYIKSPLRFNENPLYKQHLFWTSIIFPFSVALGFSVPLMLQGLNFNFTSDGYAFFAKEFAFPLWISSGAIIFGVTVGRFHGSLQRHKAIEQTELNNNFKNYFEHRQMFFEKIPFDNINCWIEHVVDGEKKDYRCSIKLDRPHLYKLLFPYNSQRKFSTELRELSNTDEHRELINRYKKTITNETDYKKHILKDFVFLSSHSRIRYYLEKEQFTHRDSQAFCRLLSLSVLLFKIERFSSEISSAEKIPIHNLFSFVLGGTKLLRFNLNSINFYDEDGNLIFVS